MKRSSHGPSTVSHSVAAHSNGTHSAHESVETEVLIVGYGPVGAALACLLGRYGVRTLVIDKSVDILPIPRAIALDSDALRILQFVGLDAQAFETVEIPYVRLVSPFVGEFARIDTSGTSDGHRRLVTFHQPDLERALRAKAAEFESVRLRCPSELLELHEVEQGVRAVIRDGDGQTQTVRARFAVGADGAASLVRSAIGVSFPGRTYQEWLVVDGRNAPRPMDHVEFICDYRRPTPHMVAPGGRQRWEFMLQSHEGRAEMESEQKVRELLAPWTGAEELTIERKAVYRFHARTCDSFQKGRIFLAGDAAHVTPPFVGQGLVAGLRDAANLSWKLAWVAKGLAPESILDSYDRERRPHAKQMIDLARQMGFLVAPSGRLGSFCVHAGLRLIAALPLMRQLIARANATKPITRYKEGLFVRGRAPGLAQRGTWLPQGRLRSADGQVRLSDTILGTGLTCIGFGRAPEPYVGADVTAQWRARGATMVQIDGCGEDVPRLGGSALEDLDHTFARYVRAQWMVVARPDGVLLHDGPLRSASRVLKEALALLDGWSPAP